MAQPPITKDSIRNRTFSYSNNDEKVPVNLSFTLRTDIKRELKDFIEILEMALGDCKEELSKIK